MTVELILEAMRGDLAELYDLILKTGGLRLLAHKLPVAKGEGDAQ
jgi:hypothetical protein